MLINCDLGESEDLKRDLKFMEVVDLINVACGYHAGTESILLQTLESSCRFDLKVGFHPGFADRENFGRKNISLTFEEIQDLIFKQYEVFEKAASRFPIPIHHIKPHGALYNMASVDKLYAEAIVMAVHRIDPSLILIGAYGSCLAEIARSNNTPFMSEVFSDRAYENDLSLRSRSLPYAVIEDPVLLTKTLDHLLNKNEVLTYDGSIIPIKADTICIHSDTLNGLEIAHLIKKIQNEQ